MSDFGTHLDLYKKFKKDAENIELFEGTRVETYFLSAFHLIDACAAKERVHINKHQRIRAVIEENEFLAPSLYERIKAARLCTEAGYKVAFHFDPVIYFEGWEKEYKNVIDLLFSTINPKHVAWVSIGTLRFNPAVKQVIERRFPANKILDEELVPGFDGKLRYPHFIRQDIYKSMLNMLSKHSRKLPVYLCMENPSAWKASGLTPRIL